MPTCQSCQRQWTWKEAFKRSFILDNGMECPYCHEMQYFTSHFRKMSIYIPFIIMTILMTINLVWGPSILVVIGYIALIPLHIFLFPLFIKLSNEKEQLL